MRRSLPAVVTEGRLPPGKTAVHAHPAADDAWELLKLMRLDSRRLKDGGVSDMLQAIRIEWPDLSITAQQLRHFVESYVDPFVVVPPGYWTKGLIQADADLNTAAAIAKVAQQMQDVWEGDKENIGRPARYDDDGNLIVPPGPTAKDHLAAGKLVVDARKIQADEQARIGFGPERKSSGLQVNVGTNHYHVDLSAAVGGGFRRPQADKVVDAKFRDGDGARAAG
jgi:hypothetical protein